MIPDSKYEELIFNILFASLSNFSLAKSKSFISAAAN